jgi:uncharacterized membrane protein (UPF0127 family)
LLFTKANDDVLLMVPCCDVHTFGMSYALDIAFIDEQGYVRSAFRDVGAGCRLRCCESYAVMERAACPRAAWYREGCFAGERVRKAIDDRRLP